MSKESSTSGGIGFTGMLTIAFIVLKLCNVIDWSWWWVLSPVWISAGLLVVVGVPLFIWLHYESKKADRKLEQKLNEIRSGGRKSKFMERLEQAMEASEKRRNMN